MFFHFGGPFDRKSRGKEKGGALHAQKYVLKISLVPTNTYQRNKIK